MTRPPDQWDALKPAETTLVRRCATAAAALAAGLATSMLALGGAAAQTTTTGGTTTTPTATTPVVPKPLTRSVATVAKTRTKAVGSRFVSNGRISGKPFGNGTFRATTRITSRSPIGIESILVATYPKRGRVTYKARMKGTGVRFTGTASVTRGTGDYRDIKGRGLKVTIATRSGIDTFRMTGKVTYTPPVS